MAKQNIKVKLVESNQQINEFINKAIIKKINSAVTLSQSNIMRDLKPEISSWLDEEQVIRDLRSSGRLNAEIGLPASQASNAAEAIVEAVSNSISLTFKPFTTKYTGGLWVNIAPEDFRDVLGIGEATIGTAKGVSLNWLDWLLKAGNRVIIKDYSVTFGNFKSGKRDLSRWSRSGNSAIMIKAGKGYWKMPSQYAGVVEDNFITRAFEGKEDVISFIITQHIKSKLG